MNANPYLVIAIQNLLLAIVVVILIVILVTIVQAALHQFQIANRERKANNKKIKEEEQDTP